MNPTQQDGKLSATEDSHVIHDPFYTNIRNLSNSRLSDRELGRRVRNMFPVASDGQLASRRFDTSRSQFINPFDMGFGFDTFGAFSGFSSKMNKLWNSMHEEMLKIDELDDFDIDESHNEEPHHSSSYTKYSSSVTSYGTDGVRKSKSVSGVEKVKNGKRSVHTKMVTQDGNNTTIEEILPNGDKKTTTRKNEGRMIEDK